MELDSGHFKNKMRINRDFVEKKNGFYVY